MLWYFLLLNLVVNGGALRLVAYLSSGGLHGEIRFEQSSENSLKIRFALQPTLQYPDQQWIWSVVKFPVDYTVLNNRCDERYLGESIIDLSEIVGPLEMPGNETGSIEIPGLSLTGDNGLWGKGLLLKDTYSSRIICASITALEKNTEKFAEARFFGPIAGTVWFRWLGGVVGENTTETIIHTDLFHVNKTKSSLTEHYWKIYVTDIFDNSKDKNNCNVLQTVFDPNNAGFGKSIGDVDARLGKIRVIGDSNKRFKTFYRDPELSLLPADLLGPHRLLYLVIFHSIHEDSFLACAKINHRKPIIAKTFINSRGIKGEVTLSQETPFDPTWVNVSLGTTNDLETRLRYATKIAAYKIHELSLEPTKTLEESIDLCQTTKTVYNPTKIDEKNVPPSGFGSQDQYSIGDLSGKLQGRKEGSNHMDILPGSAKLSGNYWDTYLPLSGTHSVIHRSLVLHKYNETDNKGILPWVCGTFVLHSPYKTGQVPMITARVIFRYPIVGQIILRQPKNDPQADTSVIVENLVHADGSSLNNSQGHRWMIHEHPPGRDFYNWSKRCLSAGSPLNPYKVHWNVNDSSRCSASEPLLCRLGDLSRHDTLDIAGRKLHGPMLTRKLFTDTLLPLSGPNSILGKSLVLYDDHGPKARGERLACSIVEAVYRRKAVVKDWFGNGVPISLRGKLEFIQQSEYDVTDVEVNLDGLTGKMSGYHVHLTPVEVDLEFPCEGTTLYGHWNPLNITKTNLSSREGTWDQYEVGDLSGKFGTLDNRKKYFGIFNDTTLALFGPRSILGRSVIIHKKEKDFRWACSTIERGYSPSEARELRAIASFHHPDGFAYGYIRMTQLIYKDGSQSDTVIEVNLRYPGERNLNTSTNHNWAIYVNPVGVDATVKIKDTRCVAAGYIWNPYFTQLADPLNDDLYKQECGSDLPLRCHVGDISARLGPIHLGLGRQVFSDPNFPLEGTVSAMGKSIVILDKNFGHYRFACSNIEPDNDIVKYANIRKPPRFVTAKFLADTRKIMGIPEWMLSIDNRETKILHDGGCIQFLLHFKGPIASRLEIDFSKLISTGKLEVPSLYIPGYIENKRKSTLGYRQCGFRDPNDKNFDTIFFSKTPTIFPSYLLILCTLLIVNKAIF